MGDIEGAALAYRKRAEARYILDRLKGLDSQGRNPADTLFPETKKQLAKLSDLIKRLKEQGDRIKKMRGEIPSDPQVDELDNTADPFGHITDPDAYDRAHNPDLYDRKTGKPKRPEPIEGSLADRAKKVGINPDDYPNYFDLEEIVKAREGDIDPRLDHDDNSDPTGAIRQRQLEAGMLPQNLPDKVPGGMGADEFQKMMDDAIAGKKPKGKKPTKPSIDALHKSDPMATAYIETIQNMGTQNTFGLNHKVVEANN